MKIILLREISGLHKEKAAKASEEQEAALSRELAVQEQLRSGKNN